MSIDLLERLAGAGMITHAVCIDPPQTSLEDTGTALVDLVCKWMSGDVYAAGARACGFSLMPGDVGKLIAMRGDIATRMCSGADEAVKLWDFPFGGSELAEEPRMEPVADPVSEREVHGAAEVAAVDLLKMLAGRIDDLDAKMEQLTGAIASLAEPIVAMQQDLPRLEAALASLEARSRPDFLAERQSFSRLSAAMGHVLTRLDNQSNELVAALGRASAAVGPPSPGREMSFSSAEAGSGASLQGETVPDDEPIIDTAGCQQPGFEATPDPGDPGPVVPDSDHEQDFAASLLSAAYREGSAEVDPPNDGEAELAIPASRTAIADQEASFPLVSQPIDLFRHLNRAAKDHRIVLANYNRLLSRLTLAVHDMTTPRKHDIDPAAAPTAEILSRLAVEVDRLAEMTTQGRQVTLPADHADVLRRIEVRLRESTTALAEQLASMRLNSEPDGSTDAASRIAQATAQAQKTMSDFLDVATAVRKSVESDPSVASLAS
ncbi:MAG: hypothetical protein AAF882_17245 [Pseudomonadota bacterium]